MPRITSVIELTNIIRPVIPVAKSTLSCPLTNPVNLSKSIAHLKEPVYL